MGSNLSDLSTDKKSSRVKTGYINQIVRCVLGVAQGLLFNSMSGSFVELRGVKTPSLH